MGPTSHDNANPGPNANRMRLGVIITCFLLVAIEGFDTGILSISVPYLAKQWHVAASAFTLSFVLTNIGVAVGYLIASAVQKSLGAAKTMALSVALFGGATLVGGIAIHLENIGLFEWIRVICGVGMGIILPVAIYVGKTYAGKWGQSASAAIAVGIAFGVIISGVLSAPIIGLGGVAIMFYGGGVIALLVLILFFIAIRQAGVVAATSALSKGNRSSWRQDIGRLLGPTYRRSTISLWIFMFCVYTGGYVIFSWLPAFAAGLGATREQIGLSMSMVAAGGLTTGLIFVFVVIPRIGGAKSVLWCVGLGTLALLALALFGTGSIQVLLVLALFSGIFEENRGISPPFVVQTFDDRDVTSAMGWAFAFGRAGSVFGPAYAGILLALSFTPRSILLFTVVPALVGIVAAVAMFVSSRRIKSTAPFVPGDAPAGAQT